MIYYFFLSNYVYVNISRQWDLHWCFAIDNLIWPRWLCEEKKHNHILLTSGKFNRNTDT